MHVCVCFCAYVCMRSFSLITVKKKEDWHELENEKSYLTKHHKDGYSILYETFSEWLNEYKTPEHSSGRFSIKIRKPEKWFVQVKSGVHYSDEKSKLLVWFKQTFNRNTFFKSATLPSTYKGNLGESCTYKLLFQFDSWLGQHYTSKWFCLTDSTLWFMVPFWLSSLPKESKHFNSRLQFYNNKVCINILITILPGGVVESISLSPVLFITW